MLNSDDLEFFGVLAQSKSLAESSRKLNVTAPAVTQRLQALEEKCGVRLLERSRHRLALTDEWILVFEYAKEIGGRIETLAESLRGRTHQVAGHLKIVSSHGFGRAYVAPVVEKFARTHPAVSASLDLVDHPNHQNTEGYDLTVHMGPTSSLDEVVVNLAPNRRVLCAAPSYLKKAPRIKEPRDLLEHRCLVIRQNNEDVTLWRLRDRAGKEISTRIKAAMMSNDGEVVRNWALAGMGVTLRSEWDVAAEIGRGKLKVVLPEFSAPAANIVASYGTHHGRSARVVAFLTMLKESLSPAPWVRKKGFLGLD